MPKMKSHSGAKKRFHKTAGGKWRHQLFVKTQEMFDALAIALKERGAVEPIHGDVERAMRPAQVDGHNIGIVKIGERLPEMGGASIEDSLR